MSSVIFSADDYFRFQKRKILRIEDYQASATTARSAARWVRCWPSPPTWFTTATPATTPSVRGYTWTMLSLNNIDIALGRGFTPADDDHGTHNAIVGYDIVDNLLGDGDPIGKEIRVDGIPYTIVGVGDRQGKMLGQSQDNWVAVPITTYQQTYGYNDSVTSTPAPTAMPRSWSGPRTRCAC
jgi:putative ABC transport system permease protein